jgi:hypothetical protein
MLMSRSHFRHLPVSGDAGRVGMLDITDVCRALIDPASPSTPPPQRPVAVIPAAQPVVSSACRTRQYVHGRPHGCGQADEARFGNLFGSSHN